FFRVASVSKLITALCVMKLAEENKISIDEDVHNVLPYKIRDQKITLRQLMTHTAGIHDGKSYNDLLGTGIPVTEILNKENLLPKADNYPFEYSNLGAGLVACVLESALNKSFEQIVQETLFKPLDIKASFYPQHLENNFANLYNVLPFREELNAYKRQHKDDSGWDKPNPLQHYTLSQGNCNINADGLLKIGRALLSSGYISQSSLNLMRTPYASFGEKDWRLRQGIGTFLFDDKSVSKNTLFGHQGFAYGAIFGLFIDPVNKDGMALCTSGCSLARREVMAYINLDSMRIWQKRDLWK
ncbi:MAG: serine hydrolase domain-containing protein, partial [Eubacteriales bacterium]|nr:serine hydrolase domain-containing protein [Eubacteriales bacterium]